MAMDPFNQLILTLVALSFLAFQGLFHAVSPWASSHVSSGFRQLGRKQKIEWNSRTVSTLHALVVGLFCFYIILFDDAVNLDPVWGDATLVKINVAITTGYLISDLLLILYFWDAIGDKFFVLHHLAALCAYYYVLGKGMLPYFANFRLLAEFSTPCVNQRWFFEVLDYSKSSKPNLANGVLMAAMFFLVRIMVMPVYYGRMYLVFGTQAIYRVSIGGRIAWLLSSFCLDVMNLMWMRKIARGCFKVLHSGGRPKLRTYENRKAE